MCVKLQDGDIMMIYVNICFDAYKLYRVKTKQYWKLPIFYFVTCIKINFQQRKRFTIHNNSWVQFKLRIRKDWGGEVIMKVNAVHARVPPAQIITWAQSSWMLGSIYGWWWGVPGGRYSCTCRAAKGGQCGFIRGLGVGEDLGWKFGLERRGRVNRKSVSLCVRVWCMPEDTYRVFRKNCFLP